MQVIYFWRAKSEQPTPLLVYIHGGGWQGGDRSVARSMILPALEAGISVASVEYRTIKDSTADGLVPPVKGPMLDCARALQFCRSKAKEWNLDKTKVALSGGSAGACTSLWLAFHDEMADPNSPDPIARESTRVLCAAVSGAQTTLDPSPDARMDAQQQIRFARLRHRLGCEEENRLLPDVLRCP
jgi:carboxylesterase type B